MKYPKGIKAVYDNGGISADRYTIVFKSLNHGRRYSYHDAVGAGSSPTVFYQHGEVLMGRHLGKKIDWLFLPKSIRNLINKERIYYTK